MIDGLLNNSAGNAKQGNAVLRALWNLKEVSKGPDGVPTRNKQEEDRQKKEEEIKAMHDIFTQNNKKYDEKARNLEAHIDKGKPMKKQEFYLSL